MRRILNKYVLLIFSIFFLVNPVFSKTPKLKTGKWYTQFQLSEHDFLPVIFEFKKENKKNQLYIINGNEQILLEDIDFQGDSIFVQFPAFASELRMKAHSKTHISGNWYNHAKKGNYFLPFWSKHNFADRFPRNEGNFYLDGKWEVTFDYKGESEKAVGLFNGAQYGIQKKIDEDYQSHINGTFLTETGDYRFLEGAVVKDSIYLSTFDGSHAFLFKALMKEDTLWGEFLSGKHYKTEWFAVKNENFELRHPDSLTQVTSEQPIAFTLPSTKGGNYTYPNSDLKDKVVLIQIMGTWCPNCLDESMYLKNLYAKYENQLEIIAVTFETQKELDQKLEKVKSYQRNLELPWEFLVGGGACKPCALELFPMLNDIMSFPTLIVIDKKGNIRKIHTGFSGPGTGKYYDQFVSSMDDYIDHLIKE
ncbi:TlpA family protein disulfide reductase [Paracrocinitomix mangrovi]|uniref:TlpA family protein disulfide reductase n=1 Tax=Paracrocinitomix mangrovi TaxID=2862509 RepID=UPI001C8ED152|nr:TlpA disulfide reductase family protein [Paracrocinitomix mangrovi]UKN00561.1 TlpA family protein disulfide reductase [Paracrocinitomix mangrovi]